MKPAPLLRGAVAVRRIRRRLTAAIAIASTVALLAACGEDTPEANPGTSSPSNSPTNSPTNAGGSGAEQATEAIEASYGSPEFKLGSEAFDATKAAGKSVWLVASTLSIPLAQYVADAAKEAMGAADVELTVYDGKQDINQMVQGVERAIGAKASAIVLVGINPAQITGAMERAEDAGVPVIASNLGDPDTPLPAGVTAQVAYDYSRGGELMADWIAMTTKGEGVGIELVTSNELPVARNVVSGFTSEIAKTCPACKVYTDDIEVTGWTTKIATQVNSALNSHPDIKYVVTVFDGMATFALPGIKSSGRKDVGIVSFNGVLSQMQLLAQQDTVVAEVGAPQVWLGWAIADQALRVLSGVEPLGDQQIGFRVFDESNIATVDLQQPEGEWYGVDVAGEYKKLWGLG